MLKTYKKLMKKCIALARKSEGKTSPNPLVGAFVLGEGGTVIGEGRHEKYGESHAEVNAIADAENRGFSCFGATIIVNLEPCSHYGKNPPCADLIVEKGFKKVVIGCVDPNPVVSGRGIKKLKDAGIEVITGVLEEECKALNEIFIKNQTKKQPFVSVKTAVTLDGKVATKTGSSKWITGEKARKDVQRLRNKYDAILAGSGTIIADDPSLTCRMRGGRNPVRVVIDSTLKTSPESNVYQNDGTKIYVAIAESVSPKGFKENVEFIKCPLSGMGENKKIDLKFLSDALFERGVTSILVEAGGELNGAFLKSGLVDKVYQYVAPKIIGDKDSKGFVTGFDVSFIDESLRLAIKSVKIFTPDILIESYIQRTQPD